MPFILGAILTHGHAGPEPAVYLTLQFIQWFTVGFVLSLVYSVFRRAWRRPLR